MAMKEMEEAIDISDSHTFIKLWKEYQRAVQVHMDMEEIDFFPLLNHMFDGVVNNAGLSDLHTSDHENSYEIDELISAANVDLTQIKPVYEAWKAFHLDHFVKEEAIMMPLTMKTAPTAEGRCLVVHDKLVSPAEARDLGEFKFFLGWCVAKLSKLGSSQQPADVATRVFLRALRSACVKSQWVRFMPILKEKCDPAIWSTIATKYNIEESDDMHLIPMKLTRVILESNLDDLPRVKSEYLASPTPRPASKAFEFNQPHNRSIASQQAQDQEFYECKCVVM
ncbi:hemerythrin domain-containing protein [archaeon]|nr:MAG: hemerythrin domain-containing protein [archaeon]